MSEFRQAGRMAWSGMKREDPARLKVIVYSVKF